MFKLRKLYERYWKEPHGSFGARFVREVCDAFDFETVLDAGCGDGTVVREFLERKKDAKGIDLSEHALDAYSRDLRRSGLVTHGSLTQLPWPDDAFDLVFSSDVLEHLPEEEVPAAVDELARVARKSLFLTISLRPSSENNRYHATLRPRAWWEAHFERAGCRKRADLVARFQKTVPGASNLDVLKAGPTSAILEELEEFIESEPYDLGGELEPWFFVFDAKRGPAA